MFIFTLHGYKTPTYVLHLPLPLPITLFPHADANVHPRKTLSGEVTTILQQHPIVPTNLSNEVVITFARKFGTLASSQICHGKPNARGGGLFGDARFQTTRD